MRPLYTIPMDDSRKLTVSELTDLIRRNLEGAFPSVVVEGELSNCKPSTTGHLYFTLKDGTAAISGVMFKNRLRYLSFKPRDGMLLRVKGSLSVYAQRGTYSIVCEEMEQAGAGDILAMLEQRKEKLAAEGLFDEGRKKPIPRFPKAIGVVTSPEGAALQDILNILKRRAGGVKVVVLPAPVQGTEAAEIIARRIEQANQWNLADVLIVGRGGGSLEDLLPFSEERVVRAVAASAIPVVSAVGHEINWALSDFAADLRAPTPSAAAELVSANREEALESIAMLRDFLYETIRARIERVRLLAKPFNMEDLEYRFRAILQPRLVRFDDAKDALLNNLETKVEGFRRRIELARRGLEAGSPLSILERGFSIVIDERTGKAIRRFTEVKPGDRLSIRPLEGIITATVEAAQEKE
ncbi:exodeoxyribonuclease VII, large subunit [Leadbettera azotonutricia ZAS-9]|uniref:Exodeoxyribonuclease 7 large subunit n=2 Tax=Leadbettera azotonutricia TaxID=150829 RepID=F5Y7U1_LEAAZ|nr:exodeoxyribonuclease VII, large subunit [Leadbettera azotonutricia ZAS-9]